MGTNKSRVIVGGKEYTVISEESKEYVNGVALYLNEKITALTGTYVGFSSIMVATLAALHVTDELFKARSELDLAREEKIHAEAEMQKHGQSNKAAQKKLNELEKQYKELTSRAQDLVERIKQMEEENHSIKDQLKMVRRENDGLKRILKGRPGSAEQQKEASAEADSVQ